MINKNLGNRKYPKVFIIISNWNQPSHTIECLESIKKIIYPNLQTIVIENGSYDNSKEIIEKACPWITMIIVKENVGYVNAYNLGINRAMEEGGDYVFITNNDTTLDPLVISTLVEIGEGGANIGMLGSKIYNYYRKDEIDFIEGLIERKRGCPIFPGKGEIDNGQFPPIKEVELLSGCALMLKREVIEKIGLMDPCFFAYYEETDWCYRAKEAGFKLVFVGDSVLWHKGSVTNKAYEFAPMPTYYSNRNQLLFLEKHGLISLRIHLWTYLRIFILLFSMGKSYFVGDKSKFQTAKWAIRGIKDYYLRHFGELKFNWSEIR